MLNKLKKLAEHKAVVFVDLFDTVLFRHIPSRQLAEQWEASLKKKYPPLKEIRLCELRKTVIQKTGRDECSVPYEHLIHEIYCEFSPEIRAQIRFEDFKDLSYTLDYSLDMASQYPNKAMITLLKKMKSSGKKLYLVTDYYLPGTACRNYLRPYRLQGLFDGIFCSCDHQKTKARGDLYDEVLSTLNVAAADAVTIGAGKGTYHENALRKGISSYRYLPLLHRLKAAVRKKTAYSFSENICRELFKNCYKNTLFGEYSLNLYYFSKKLFREIRSLDQKKAFFLARGGYFLKKCFENYTMLLPDDQRIQSIYLKNSRKVNKLALQDQNDMELLGKYLAEHIAEKEICVVDEGWYCTSQIAVEKLYPYKIHGFYIGIMGRSPEDRIYDRKGLLFDIDEAGKTSPYFGVFRTNCTFYEQLLSAPHGSTVKYRDSGDGVVAVEDWQEVERRNYYENIEPMQDIISDYCLGLQAWGADLSFHELSGYVIRTLLFGSDERLEVLKKITDAWYDNANDTKEKNFGRRKDIKLSLAELIVKPENYLRYFCKIKEYKSEHKIIRIVYPVLGPMIYLYCRLSIFLRYKVRRGASADRMS